MDHINRGRRSIVVTDIETREEVRIHPRDIHAITQVSDTERARIIFSGLSSLANVITVETFDEVSDLLLEA